MIKEIENEQKFKELIIYISRLSMDDENCGATKLNKLLFFTDFLAYLNLGKSISGQEYQKLPNGPAPKRLVPVRRAMKNNNDIVFYQNNHFGYEQHRIIPTRDADLSLFSPQEIHLINYVVREFEEKNGSEVSEISHQFAGWKLAELNEIIPYEVSLVGNRELTSEEIEYGRSLHQEAQILVG
jgi:hypothetical protein